MSEKPVGTATQSRSKSRLLQIGVLALVTGAIWGVISGVRWILKAPAAPRNAVAGAPPAATAGAPSPAGPSEPAADPALMELADQVRAAVGSLRGTFPIRGVVRGEDDAGRAGSSIFVISDEPPAPEAAGWPAPPPLAARSAADGSFTLEVPAVWPRLPGLVLLHAGPTDRIDPEQAGRALELRQDLLLPRGGLDLGTLRVGAGRRVAGRVVAAGGAPVAGAEVMVLGSETDELFPVVAPPGIELPTATTDGDGRFVIDGISDPLVRVEVRAGDWSNGFAADVAVPGPPCRIEVAPRARIDGQVVDDRGAPIPGAQLLATLAGPACTCTQRAVAGPDGSFRLDRLERGYYVLAAGARGMARTLLPRVHTDVRGLRVLLVPLAAAKVTLLGAPRDIAIPVTWRTVTAGNPPRPSGRLHLAWAEEGALLVAGIPAGRHALELSVPGASPLVTAEFDAVAGQTTELGTIRITAGATLTGRVMNAAGQPLAGRVALAPPHLTTFARTHCLFDLPDRLELVTQADGRFEWEGLAAGERAVALRAPGCSDLVRVVSLVAGEVAPLGDLALPPAGALHGTIRSRDGRLLARMQVQAESAGSDPAGLQAAVETDGAGVYSFAGLKPGRWRVTVVLADRALPVDLAAALAPRENPTALVDVTAGGDTTRDFQLAD